MPYIKKNHRVIYRDLVDQLSKSVLVRCEAEKDLKLRPGHLNYIITKLLQYSYGTPPRYSDYNEMIGILECAKLELYRRAVAVYEDEKIRQEGDVY
jgi:hypothetical protein